MTQHPNDRDRGSGARPQAAWLAVGAVALGGLICAALLTRQPTTRSGTDSAPGRTARQTRFGQHVVVGRTVTIHRARDEVYAFWRDPANLPAIMSEFSTVTEGEKGIWRWEVAARGGMTVHLETEIVSDRPGAEIAWKSTEASQIQTQGKVMFRDAPQDRGTEVEAVIAYTPLFGKLGRLVTKLAGNAPETQGRYTLKRLKMLLETGEVATSRNRRETDAEGSGNTHG